MNHEDQEKIRRIMVCVNRIDGIYYKLAKRIGVKENTLSLFYALSDGKPHSQKEICDEWLVPRSTLNTIVSECVEKGYVRLEKSARAKQKLLLLTERGEGYADRLMKELFEVEQAAFSETRKRYGEGFVQGLAFFTDELERQVLHSHDD